jgi:hypothetical protein
MVAGSRAARRAGGPPQQRSPRFAARATPYRRNAYRGGAARGARVALAALLGALAACAQDPVSWRDPAPSGAAPDSAARLVVVAAGRAAVVPAPAEPPPPSLPAGACVGSARVARGRGGTRYAVWWQARADSSAALLAARSDDAGRTWGAPVPVDTFDRAALGCARPAPAVAADSASGYVHVAYFLVAPEGAGVFFAHAPEREAMFHAPVVIVFGERPVAVSVAARGDTVAVAYEDPNGAARGIGLALSATQGHVFERRLPLVSSPSVPATSPRVALGPRTVAVAWAERGELVVRVGQLR